MELVAVSLTLTSWVSFFVEVAHRIFSFIVCRAFCFGFIFYIIRCLGCRFVVALARNAVERFGDSSCSFGYRIADVLEEADRSLLRHIGFSSQSTCFHALQVVARKLTRNIRAVFEEDFAILVLQVCQVDVNLSTILDKFST